MEEVRKVLIVEDNLDDLRIMERAFRSRPSWEIKLVEDGEKALDALGTGSHKDERWYPHLIILNLNIPKIDGHGVLRWIKGSPEIAPIPVVIWSISVSEGDIALSYKLGAAGYFSKPVETEDLLAQARAIRSFYDQARLYEP